MGLMTYLESRKHLMEDKIWQHKILGQQKIGPTNTYNLTLSLKWK